MTCEPEKLSMWDRIFNRYRTSVIAQGTEKWNKYQPSTGKQLMTYSRDFVKYQKIDRLTGSVVKIYVEYLN